MCQSVLKKIFRKRIKTFTPEPSKQSRSITFSNHCVENLMVLNSNDQLFAAKYLTYMPTQEELRREIEQQKEFFRLQNEK